MLYLRWLLLDFTDSRFDLTRVQKRDIRRRARRIRFFDRPVFTIGMPLSNDVRQVRVRRRWRWANLAGRLPPFAVYLLWLALLFVTPGLFRQGPALLVIAMVVIAAAILWVMTCAIGYALAKPWYRYAMYELGYEMCADCGYPLFGLAESTRCPECGWRKTHRDDLPPVQWTEQDRRKLRSHGYEVCNTCGGLLLRRDDACPRCGESNAASPAGT